MRRVALRTATPADRDFLLGVYASTREQELSVVSWGDEQRAAFLAQQFAAQERHYATYEGASFDVVLVDGEPAGRLFVARWPGEIRIMDIALLPPFRGRGVGTELIEALLAEAAAAGSKVSIHVEHENPAAALYRRLGFEPVEEVSEVYARWETRPG